MMEMITGIIGGSIGRRFMDFIDTYETAVTFKDIENEIINIIGDDDYDDLQRLGDDVAPLLDSIDSMVQLEFGELFIQKYIIDNNKASRTTCLPLLGYLYSLNNEILASTLKTFKTEDPVNWKLLMKVDDDRNIARKVTNHIVTKPKSA